MMLHHARRDARTADGEMVTLEHQTGPAGIMRQSPRPSPHTAPSTPRGSYRVQADLAAVHATTEDAAGTDWAAMVSLYDELLRLGPSPVVAPNRAIAVGMSDGPLAGLAALDDLADEPKLAAYHLLPAARADLLARGGLTAEAVVALDDAITLAPTAQDRRQLARRRDELAGDIERGDVKEREQP